MRVTGPLVIESNPSLAWKKADAFKINDDDDDYGTSKGNICELQKIQNA